MSTLFISNICPYRLSRRESIGAPTAPMVQEAAQAGSYVSPLGSLKLPKLQIRTLGQLLGGEGFAIPSAALLMGVSRAGRKARAEMLAALEWEE